MYFVCSKYAFSSVFMHTWYAVDDDGNAYILFEKKLQKDTQTTARVYNGSNQIQHMLTALLIFHHFLMYPQAKRIKPEYKSQ